jgi:tetrahydromethanopterin S-methyltransferase subunit H
MITNAEKIQIIDGHLKQLAYEKYNAEIKIEYNSINPELNDSEIEVLNNLLADLNAKIQMLESKKTLLG